MIVRNEIRKNTYYDSVTLMRISKEIKKMDGVLNVLVGMGTALNKELAENLNLLNEPLKEIAANDFFIAASLKESGLMASLVLKVDDLLAQKKTDAGSDYRPVTLEHAFKQMEDANLVLISIPGPYAKGEVKKALENDKHVMLFSDNVSIADELLLKELAVSKGLLMMGPDCGTAIINGIPLAFANRVNKGNIGVIGASGTGTQEVTVLIDQLDQGVSQVIGTGGRDLKSEIGGLMMVQAFEALLEDPFTQVIVLISKPPGPDVAKKVLALVKKTSKPVVVDFIGGDVEAIRRAGAYPAMSLEDAAYKAVALAKGEKPKDFEGFSMADDELDALVKKEIKKLTHHQRNLRGFYTGGTLADEAMKILSPWLDPIYSNVAFSPDHELKNLTQIKGHAIIDLGDDQFTVGRPHPMIDPSTRSECLETCLDESVAVILLDLVLGYGSHKDPALEVVKAIRKYKEKVNYESSILCSICGTAKDIQNLAYSRKILEEEGVIVMPSNAQAARLAKKIMKGLYNE